MARKRKKQKNKKKRTAMFSCLTRTKSIMVSTRESMSPAYNVYVRFCKETTLHGLKHTVEDKLHWLERLLWFILTLSAFLGAVYCGLAQLSRYNSEPVVVSLQRDYRGWWTRFPAVTACFLDRVDPEKAMEAIERIWNVTEESDPGKYQYYFDFIDLIADVSFRTNLQNFWKYQSDETVRGVDLLQLAWEVHPNNTLNSIASQVEREVVWYPVMTEVGVCFTCNSEYAQYQLLMPEEYWKPEELLKCHYHSGQCFVRIDSMNNGVRYFIHSPFEISTAISNPTGEVMPGEELIIDFKAVEIEASSSVKTLRPEQRRCRYPDERISKSVKAYSFALCQMHCRSQMAIMFCGCRPYFHIKGDGDVCDAHGMACISRNVEILINLPKNLAKCSCLPQCAELNYYSHTKKIVIRAVPVAPTSCIINVFVFANMNGSNSETEQESMSALRINMMPPKIRLHRDVIFTLEDLFASLGGTTALFVGASVLTVVETGLFIIRHLVKLLMNKRNMKRVKVLEFKH